MASRWEGLYFDSYDPWEHLGQDGYELNDFGEAVPVEYDPFYDCAYQEEPLARHYYDIQGHEEFGYSVFWSTNDNLDRGYPTETAACSWDFKTLKDVIDCVGGPSHFGINGCYVEVKFNDSVVLNSADFLIIERQS